MLGREAGLRLIQSCLRLAFVGLAQGSSGHTFALVLNEAGEPCRGRECSGGLGKQREEEPEVLQPSK